MPHRNVSGSVFAQSPYISVRAGSPLQQIAVSVVLLRCSSNALVIGSSVNSRFAPSVSLGVA